MFISWGDCGGTRVHGPGSDEAGTQEAWPVRLSMSWGPVRVAKGWTGLAVRAGFVRPSQPRLPDAAGARGARGRSLHAGPEQLSGGTRGSEPRPAPLHSHPACLT